MIIDNDTFERVLDSFSSIIDDIEDVTLRSNLQDIFESLYTIYECVDLEELEAVKGENEVLVHLLAQSLSHEQKLYVKFKYGIDVDNRVTHHNYNI